MNSVIKHRRDQLLMGVIYRALFMLITSFNALMIVKLLTSAELGIWYIFMAIQTLLFILNSALTPNISRQYSIAFSEYGDSFDVVLFHSKIIGIYNKIIIIATFIGVVFTATYLNFTVNIFSEGNIFILISWLIVFMSVLMEIYFTSYECAINGQGEFKKVNKINFNSRLILTIGVFVLLFWDVSENSLLLFCVLYFFSNLMKRLLIVNLFNNMFLDGVKKNKKITIDFFHQIKDKLKKLTFLSLISSIGGVLIVRSGIFILPFYTSIDEIASYGLTYQLYELGFNVIFTLTIIATPSWISAYRQKIEYLKRSFMLIKYSSLLLMFIYGVAISLLGERILLLANIETKLQSTTLCIYFIFIFTLQLNHSISGQLLTIQNKIPFAYASLFSGIITLILSAILIKYYSVAGAVYAIMLSQLIYNNWKWPYEAYKFLRKNGHEG